MEADVNEELLSRAKENWRIGRKVPINVYSGDRPVCQCHNEEDAQAIVTAMDEVVRLSEAVARGYVQVDSIESSKRIKELEAENQRLSEGMADICMQRDMKIVQLEAENQRLRQRVEELGAARSKMFERAAGMQQWLLKVAPQVFEEQKHLNEGTEARAYWHYGSFSALVDACQLLEQTKEQPPSCQWCLEGRPQYKDAKDSLYHLHEGAPGSVIDCSGPEQTKEQNDVPSA